MTYTASKFDSIPIPVQPAVLSVYVPNTIAETNIPVYIPWRNCRLAYAYSVNVVAIDNTGASKIDIELNAAAGGDMMTIALAQNGAVGTVTEATVVTAANCENLSRDNADRDAVNIEIDGSSSAAGGVMLYMYFESN